MRRLLFLNSIGLLSLTLVFESCQARKERKGSPKQDVVNYVPADSMVHQPGTLNQQKLDSIKEIRMKEKRNFKK